MVDAATIFVVTDIAKGTKHYRGAPGFTVTFAATKKCSGMPRR
jgi:hypothetical protein